MILLALSLESRCRATEQRQVQLSVLSAPWQCVSVLLPSSTCTRQRLAELLGKTQSTDLDGGTETSPGQHLLLYTTKRCKVALKFFSLLVSGQHCFGLGLLPEQEKKMSLLKKEVVILKYHMLI